MLMSDPTRHRSFLREFTRHEPAVRAFVRRLVPSRCDADDILQEVSIVLWEKFDTFHADGDFRAWACGIARYKVLSWLRDKGREKLVLANDVIELIAEESIAAESHLAQQRQALDCCFAKLSANERDLLSKAYQADAKIQEVAATSGRSVAGFYQWLYRMRKMLLDCVQREVAQERVS